MFTNSKTVQNSVKLVNVTKAMLAINVKPAKKRGRCQSCPRKLDLKSEHRCTKCNNFVCGKHANNEDNHVRTPASLAHLQILSTKFMI